MDRKDTVNKIDYENVLDQLELETAKERSNNPEVNQILSILHAEAEKKESAEARYTLGMCYLKGLGVRQDESRAFELFMQAANAGFAAAQYEVGKSYEQGSGVAQDDQLALKYIQLAAENNYPEAQATLGFFYHSGKFVQKNLKEAEKWYLRSKDNKLVNASYNLGLLYYHGSPPEMKPDYQKALECFKLAAKYDDELAMGCLGSIYHKHLVVVPDFKEEQYKEQALEWFEKGAALNDPQSLMNLAEFYHTGYAVQKDVVKAAMLYRMAIEQYPLQLPDEKKMVDDLKIKFLKLFNENKDNPLVVFEAAIIFPDDLDVQKQFQVFEPVFRDLEFRTLFEMAKYTEFPSALNLLIISYCLDENRFFNFSAALASKNSELEKSLNKLIESLYEQPTLEKAKVLYDKLKDSASLYPVEINVRNHWLKKLEETKDNTPQKDIVLGIFRCAANENFKAISNFCNVFKQYNEIAYHFLKEMNQLTSIAFFYRRQISFPTDPADKKSTALEKTSAEQGLEKLFKDIMDKQPVRRQAAFFQSKAYSEDEFCALFHIAIGLQNKKLFLELANGNPAQFSSLYYGEDPASKNKLLADFEKDIPKIIAEHKPPESRI